MFDYIRNNTRLMGFLLALFIVPAFVLVGVDGYRNFTGRGETVATVAGFSIKKDRWDAAHRQDVDRIRASNPSVDAKLLDSDEVRFSSLERLVREQLLGSFAEKNHVQISDQRLAREIQRDPFIASLRQPDGSIDIARYREALARQGMTPALYEQNVRQDIEKSQVLQSVQTSGLVTPEIAKWALNPFFERRDVQFVRFQPAAYRSQIKTSDAEIEAFYDSNKRLFEAPEQVDVEYIVLDLPSVAQAIAISDVDVRSYYEQNANRYTTKEERRARHILLTLDAKASDKKTEIRQQMQVLSDQIKLNPNVFAELAKKHSQDPGSAPTGGDLGFFQRGAMVKQFEDAAFALKKGEVSDIIETEFGFHLIQLTDVKPAVQRTLDQVKAEIDAELKKQQTQRTFSEKAEAFGNLVYEQADALTPVAERLKLKVQTFKGLTRQPKTTAVPEALKHEKLLSEVFAAGSLKNKQNTAAVEVGANQLIAARVLAHRPAASIPLTEIKAQVQEQWLVKESQRLARQDGEKTLASFKEGKDTPVKLGASVVVSRNEPKGLTGQALMSALNASPHQLPGWVGLDQGNQGYVIIKINKVIPRDPPPTEVALQEVQQYEQWWSGAETAAYYRALKQRFKVEVKIPQPKPIQTINLNEG